MEEIKKKVKRIVRHTVVDKQGVIMFRTDESGDTTMILNSGEPEIIPYNDAVQQGIIKNVGREVAYAELDDFLKFYKNMPKKK